MPRFLLLLALVGVPAQLRAQLPAREPAQRPDERMVEGISNWLIEQTTERARKRRPSRERLQTILGVVDQRVGFDGLELVATTEESALVAENALFRVYAVRWNVLDGMTAQGLYFQPRGRTVARVVAIPDAAQLPEEFADAQRLAAAGCEVLCPVLIGREDTWSGNPRFRMTNQSHREFVYRMAFEVGRHPIGYEVQKTLAAVDWFISRKDRTPVGVWGYGEGGAVALYSAVLDARIQAAGISGYFGPREGLWRQPIDRNVWGLLRDFGDAELAGMILPRSVIIDNTPGPSWVGNPETAARRGAAPGVLSPFPEGEVEREAARAPGVVVAAAGLEPFLKALGARPKPFQAAPLPLRRTVERARTQLGEMVAFTQRAVRSSQDVRDAIWSKADRVASPEEWSKLAPALRAKLWDDVLGRLPAPDVPLGMKMERAYSGAKWDGYDCTYDVFRGVIGYGVLLVPRNIPVGERRPIIVLQHGLEGRPQDLFAQVPTDRDSRGFTKYHFYQNIGDRFADLGYIVYLPQNPYIGDFRKISRLANPLGWSMFSFILAQQERLLDWLQTLPYADPSRVGFYGLSYGGKTAVRIPPLLERYTVAVCSGDFNEWITKVSSVDLPFSYVFTQEYEMPEFNLGGVANHGEMAKLMAPRPFMVERGHRDGVGIDEMVAFEYAKVKRFYDEMGIGDRTEIAYFNGPHMMHAVEAVEFLRKHLGR
jgi:dienelactone hydrolase